MESMSREKRLVRWRGAVSVWWVLCGAALPASAHDSCCAKAAIAAGGAVPSEWIPDPAARQPDGWDEEDDGPWEPPLIKKPAPSSFDVFREELLNAASEVSPWLLIGLLGTGVAQVFQPPVAVLRRHLAGPQLLAVSKGALLGLIAPVCNCGALPLAVGLAAGGSGPPAIVSFIVAAQSAGVDSLVFTIGVLGPATATLRMVAAYFIAVATGLAAPAALTNERQRRQFEFRKEDPLSNRIRIAAYESVTSRFDEVAVSVAFGFTVSSALAAFLPSGTLGATAAIGGVGGRAAVLLIALPFQFCEHASVPLAAALQRAGASGGLAFAILATLPSMNLSSLGIIIRLVGVVGALRVAFALWLSGFVGSFIADAVGLSVLQTGHGHGGLPEGFEAASKWIMSGIAVVSAFRLVHRTFISRGKDAHCGEGRVCKDD